VTKKIFHSILFAALAAMLAIMAAGAGCLYHMLGVVQERRLQSELALAAPAVEKSGAGYLKELNADEPRLTWVGPDGAVLYDTKADAASMENHADREEIREALSDGSGQSVRYSSTLLEKTIYCAVPLSDGTVLRACASYATILALFAGIVPCLLPAALLTALLARLLARRLSRRIIAPLERVDLEHPLDNDTYEELAPLLGRIHRQQEQINSQLLQLRQKADEFDQITASMKEGLVLLDADGKILSINPSAAALFRVEGNPVGMELLRIERSRELDRAAAAALAHGHAGARETRNGREYQFDISRIESAGKVMGLVILAFDISERELAERARREFTANVSHELKTPLTSIIASAELMEQKLVKQEDMPRFVGHIRTEASHLLALIEDIIRLSQLDEGMSPESEPVDLAEVAGEVVEQLRHAARQRNVQLVFSAQRCVLQGAPRLLHEIVYNLLDNAIKYNVDAGTAAVAVTKGCAGAQLRVSDTGIGIQKAQQARVFERFYRVDQSHSKRSGGTGLGLSIVKHAAAYFHADINLQSEPGKGTTITVTFPP